MFKRKHGDSFVLLDDELNVIDWNPSPGGQAIWYQVEIRSVQHTGTNFIHQVLNEYYYCRATHWTSANSKEQRLIFAPIRRPEDTWVTWCSRERQEDFYTQWSLFNDNYLKNKNLYILPIDTDDREEHLENIRKVLKVDLKTDWKPVESRPHKDYRIRDFSDIYELEVVRKYYG